MCMSIHAFPQTPERFNWALLSPGWLHFSGTLAPRVLSGYSQWMIDFVHDVNVPYWDQALLSTSTQTQYCVFKLGDTYLKSWMTEFFEDFFSVCRWWNFKKTPSPSLRHGRSEKNIYYSLTETPPLLLLIVYELQYYVTMLVSLLLWHCACTRHFKRFAVQWLVCAVDQKQDWLGGWE